MYPPKMILMYDLKPKKTWWREISGRILFYSKILDIDEQLFHLIDKSVWEEFCPDAEEAIRGNAHPPRVKPLYVRCYVDANHADNLLTRWSHTGIIIFVDNYQIIWYSKLQNTVELSCFGSKFIALRKATDMIEGLWYKLHMFGVLINVPAGVFSDK